MRLAAARACAWALLMAGWIGIGALALRYAPTLAGGFALTALWLLALGAVAALAQRSELSTWRRASALAAAAGVTALGLWALVQGGGTVPPIAALIVALAGWAALTALASGVVRRLRLEQRALPQPPVGSAAFGALLAAIVVADPGDVQALAARLAVFVLGVACVLVVLQGRPGMHALHAARACRAGLFDCSLPAWPAGAWRDLAMWPTLLAGLAMLPMMAALPLMVDACRAAEWPAPLAVALHLAAMFGPALALQGWLARRAPATLAALCAALLVGGALAVALLPRPWDLLALALAHGSAWGLAWSGQLWAPARRGQQGSSAWRAALGYAALTLLFGFVVEALGTRGIGLTHAALGALAAAAWLLQALLSAGARNRAARGMPLPRSGRR